ncbi:MAG: hypothetical protein LBD41_01025, partial [Clostridiales Family XIII bacterium]|nr:hypothetical protein [Clostridiales Family XIII bacterium]
PPPPPRPWDAFFRVARGEYFKPMCADDLMRCNCLEILLTFLDSNQNVAGVFGNMEFINEEGFYKGQNWFDFKNINSSMNLLALFIDGVSTLPYPAALIRMEEMRKNKYDKVIFGMIDMCVWIQILARGLQLKLLRYNVIDYRIHPGQISSSSKYKEIYRRSNFEAIFFYEYFFKLNLENLKKILPYDPFVLDTNEEKFKDFVLAHNFMQSTIKQKMLAGIFKIKEILNDDKLRVDIERKYNYGIKEFREFYSNADIYDFSYKSLQEIKTSELITALRRQLRSKIKSIFKRRSKGNSVTYESSII